MSDRAASVGIPGCGEGDAPFAPIQRATAEYFFLPFHVVPCRPPVGRGVGHCRISTAAWAASTALDAGERQAGRESAGVRMGCCATDAAAVSLHRNDQSREE